LRAIDRTDEAPRRLLLAVIVAIAVTNAHVFVPERPDRWNLLMAGVTGVLDVEGNLHAAVATDERNRLVGEDGAATELRVLGELQHLTARELVGRGHALARWSEPATTFERRGRAQRHRRIVLGREDLNPRVVLGGGDRCAVRRDRDVVLVPRARR